jgi:tRNA A-37 threonylcarbamoyl transferase component Bud32
MLSPGSIIDGKFEIVSFVGEGGMGSVYTARHMVIGRNVALKLLREHLINEPEKIARFRNEARVLSELDHPNIVAVHAVGIAESGQPYMAMDIVSGESLDEMIKRRGYIPQAETLLILEQVCQALGYSHSKQVVHRDIKPSNIIISNGDAGVSVKLVDFGIAKMLASKELQLTQTGMAIGSIFYLSPGQMEGRAADAGSDIYSLGCTAYEMLTGMPPFASDNAFEVALKKQAQDLPPLAEANPEATFDPRLQQIIDTMLKRDPAQRYSSIDQLVEDLRLLKAAQPLAFAVPTDNVRKHSSIFGAKRVLIIASALSIIGAVSYMLVVRTQQAPVVDDKAAIAKAGIEEIIRRQVIRLDITQQRAVMIRAGNVVKLCEESGQKALIAEALMQQAWAMKTLMAAQSLAHQPYDYPEMELANYKIAKRAADLFNTVLPQDDPIADGKYRLMRFRAQLFAFCYPSTEDITQVKEDGTLLVQYFEDAQKAVTRDDVRSLLFSMGPIGQHKTSTGHIERTPERVRFLFSIRGQALRILHRTQTEMETDFADQIAGVSSDHSALIPVWRKEFGLPPRQSQSH